MRENVDDKIQIYIAPELRNLPREDFTVIRHSDDTDASYASRVELFDLFFEAGKRAYPCVR
jgi:hypothetical protein